MKSIEYFIEKANELINSSTVSKDLKDKTKKWLESIGKKNFKESSIKWGDAIKDNITTIDELITFSSSEEGKKYFGEEKALEVYNHANEVKDNGGLYCDCEACKIGVEILENFLDLEVFN